MYRPFCILFVSFSLISSHSERDKNKKQIRSKLFKNTTYMGEALVFPKHGSRFPTFVEFPLRVGVVGDFMEISRIHKGIIASRSSVTCFEERCNCISCCRTLTFGANLALLICLIFFFIHLQEVSSSVSRS